MASLVVLHNGTEVTRGYGERRNLLKALAELELVWRRSPAAPLRSLTRTTDRLSARPRDGGVIVFEVR